MTDKSNPFTSFKIKRQHIHEQIADHIQEMVAENELREGEQLPSERDLALMLGVNRGSIRQAISLLQHRGLVQTRLGSGTYITRIPSDVLGESIERYVAFGTSTHADLLDLRELMEPGIAALAAQRATDEDLARLQALVERVEATNAPEALAKRAEMPGGFGEALADAVAADADFHQALAAATHNDLVIAIMSGLQGAMRTWIAEQTGLDRGRLLDAVRGHRVICQAIIQRDPEAARDAMRLHIGYARAALQK